MKAIVFASILLFFGIPWCAQGQVTEQKVDQMGKNGERYTAVEPFQVQDWSVFGDQPRYKPSHPEMLDGYQRATAGELGISEVFNEMGKDQAPLVRLNPNEAILYSGGNYYLDNCQWFIGGKWIEFKNRIKPIAPSPPSIPASQPVSVKLSDYTPITLIPLGPYTSFEPGQYVLVLVWDEGGRRWFWRYTPLWCVDVRHPRELYKPAVCAGVAVGAYALAGGFAGAITKIPVHTISLQ